MKEKTKKNVYTAFIGEAKAYFRLLAYAEKAEEEGVPQIALLFRAIADAERVHAARHLNLVKDMIVKDTDTNLEKSFQREKSISENEYLEFIKDAEEDGEKADHVCQVCGYVTSKKIPDKCPICGATKDKFKTIGS